MNVLLSGAAGSGRTAFAGRLAEQFRRQGFLSGGFLCLSRARDGDGPASVIVDLLSGGTRSFGRPSRPDDVPGPGETAVGPWFLSASGFAFGAQAVGRAVTLKTPLVFLDEIGPLELDGGGFRWIADLLIRGPLQPPVLIGVVREGTIARIRDLYPGRSFEIIPVDGASAEAVFLDLRRSMRGLGTQLRELR